MVFFADAELEHDPELGAPHEGRISLHAKQLKALTVWAPINLIIAGIRGGKTHVGALKSILYAMAHPCGEDDYHLVASPTYQMSKVPVEKVFRLLYDKSIFPICPLVRYIRSERTFLLAAANGATTRLTVRSLHEPDRLRGIKCLSAWLDEAAYVSTYAWEVVQGRLMDSNGPCWITTTPNGYNWVYDLYMEALQAKRDGVPIEERTVRVVHWSSLENVYASRQGIIRQASRYDSKTHSQEVDAKFVRGRGLVYHSFSRALNVVRGRINPLLPVWIGQDFNVDPMASVIAQPFRTKDGKEGAHVIAERQAPDSDTFGLIHFLDAWTREHRIPKERVTIYPDASGKNRSTSGKSDFQLLREAGYRLDAPKANPPIRDRINCVNGLLRPIFSKHPRLLIDPDCGHIIEALERLPYDEGSDPPVPDKTLGFDHLTEALGYKCWRRWPIRRAAGLGNLQGKKKAA